MTPLLRRSGICSLLVTVSLFCRAGEEPAPLLAQNPTLSRERIVFVFANDLWSVARTGGEAVRLTSDIGSESDPRFSPNGEQIAFTGEYDGNVDVYVIPARGGAPRRLTYHPDPDRVLGWTPDGSQIVFSSGRSAPSGRRDTRLFLVSTNGGFPNELPLPRANNGCLSPDGKRIAYMPFDHFQRPSWKRYRGGSTPRIWIADLSDSSVFEIPRDNSNDFQPMWVNDDIYYLSDRSGPVNLHKYNLVTKAVTMVLPERSTDIKSASTGPGGIVYEEFGNICLYDFATGQSTRVPINIVADMPLVRAQFKSVPKTNIVNAHLSPSGVRMVFEAHGEILTAPAEKGDIRYISNTPGAMERDPAWSPDGESIAYFSDASGEYELHVAGRNGRGQPRKFKLGDAPSFYYSPIWSPDSKQIVYYDKRLTLWLLELSSGASVKINTDIYEHPQRGFDAAWSPDSRFIAYTRQLANHFRTVFIYSLENKKSVQITDGMSDARYPVFDAGGKYLYFSSSTDLALGVAWLNMSSIFRPLTRNLYVCVLDKDLPSPVAPEQDDEKEAKKDGSDSSRKLKKEDDQSADSQEKQESIDSKDSKESSKSDRAKGSNEKTKIPIVKIDFENVGQRIVALPIPAHRYGQLWAGRENLLFFQELGQILNYDDPRQKMTIQRFDLAKRKTEKVVEDVLEFDLSANGEKILYFKNDDWSIGAASEKPEAKSVKLDGLTVYVDPRAEWKQMYHETWRIERDFLYDPNFHGLNLKEAERRYLPYLNAVASRSDLNYLFQEMLGDLTLGHVYVRGGDIPQAKKVKVGLLGADYVIENARYRFSRIYNGENWNPELIAPLTQPGVNVQPGDYLLEVRGRLLTGNDEVYSLFEGTAGKSISIKVGPNSDGTGAREVTVVPIESETALRNLSWIEDNRRKVNELSGGRLAYVYLPNTSIAGYRSFNRYFFAQTDKQGVILDERYNGGGLLADYIIDYLRRPVMSYVASREGQTYPEPTAAIFGPKVMIINESAGSGGDAMPWYFKRAEIGKLVGTRTWGGLVGIGGYPALMDGGTVTAPRFGIYGLRGEWEVENVGIAPDVDVQLDPKLWRENHDSQLEKAVSVALEELERNPLPRHPKPAYPNYHRNVDGK